jgi:hypothetical protein
MSGEDTRQEVGNNLSTAWGMGDNESKAQASLKDAELINQFKKIAALPDEEKTLVLKMITAYIRDFNTQQAYAL